MYFDGLRFQHGPHETHRVAGQVPQRAAAQPRIQPNVTGAVEREGEHPADQAYDPDGALGHQPLHVARLRMVPHHHGFLQDHPIASSRFGHAVHVGRGRRQRLLAQDVFAGVRRTDRPFGVQRVGHADVHDVHLRVRQQGFIAAVCAGNVPRRGVAIRLVLASACAHG